MEWIDQEDLLYEWFKLITDNYFDINSVTFRKWLFSILDIFLIAKEFKVDLTASKAFSFIGQ